MTADNIATIASAFVGIASLSAGIVIAWKQFREVALRKGDVLAWYNDVISTLESLFLITILIDKQLDADETKSKISDIIFNTAILVERGRMFFKNEKAGDYGAEKQSAYQGYRPKNSRPNCGSLQDCVWVGRR